MYIYHTNGVWESENMSSIITIILSKSLKRRVLYPNLRVKKPELLSRSSTSSISKVVVVVVVVIAKMQ